LTPRLFRTKKTSDPGMLTRARRTIPAPKLPKPNLGMKGDPRDRGSRLSRKPRGKAEVRTIETGRSKTVVRKGAGTQAVALQANISLARARGRTSASQRRKPSEVRKARKCIHRTFPSKTLYTQTRLRPAGTASENFSRCDRPTCPSARPRAGSSLGNLHELIWPTRSSLREVATRPSTTPCRISMIRRGRRTRTGRRHNLWSLVD
jgi:hypothetical protein